MSSIKDFLFDATDELREKVFPSPRFKTPFEIRAISETRNEELRKNNTKVTINKRMGRKEKSVDQDAYISDLVLECIVSPDLSSKEMQDHYKTPGDPAATLKAMLLPGEYSNIIDAIQELNGFDNDLDELREEVKND